MITHTPGPWVPTARTGENLTPATYVIEDADRLPVVMAWRAPDALLIAAAPDMLSALARIEAVAHYYSKFAGVPAEIKDAFTAILGETAAALAKTKEA